MIFIVLFEDVAEKAPVRAEMMPQHLAFLDQNAAKIRAAGPLFHTRSGREEGAGGLWMVEAATRAEVQHLVEADPFWPTGLRRSVEILQWKQVFAEGQKLI